MTMILIDLAIETALKSHAGQQRKGTDIPYAVHPLAVGMILAGAGCSDEVIAAGILHDTIEDTAIAIDQIQAMFGDKVASLVAACSEPDKSLPWEIRKRQLIASMKNAVPDVRVIACADKLHNLRTMVRDRELVGEDFWNRFNRGRSAQAWYYKEFVEALCQSSDQGKYEWLFQTLRAEVQRFFEMWE
jgi:(p)ppGpp synthase/HD superfamily hydrolase